MRMQLGIIIFSLLLAYTVAQTDTDWHNFKLTFKKNYTSADDTKRKSVFAVNYQKILAHNANADKGLATFRMAPNHLADKTQEERKALLGAKVSPAAIKQRMLSLRQVAATTTAKPTTKTTTKPMTTTTTKPTTTTPKSTTKTTTKLTTTTKPTTTPITTKTTAKPTTTAPKPTTITTTKSTTTTKPTTTATTTKTTAKPTTTAPKPTVDYRNSSCTAAIKDQGQCGSCWAFSATYETEFYNCKAKGALTLLSEQNLVDCDPYSGGCYGGLYDNAWDYTINAKGQCPSSSYPYKAVGGTCNRSSCTPAGTLTSYNYIANNVTAIMEAVTKNGPVSAALDSSLDSFSYYASGVYADPACTTGINHAVNIVGYGTDATGIPYWIIRNSWGKYWGMNGYMFIKRGVNMCGIEDWVAYPVV